MQANCSQCGHIIVLDDARLPEGPFGVRCPKCQTTLRFPGRSAASAPAPPAAAAPAAPRPAAAPAAPHPAATPPATGRVTVEPVTGMGAPWGVEDGPGRVLVALDDASTAGVVAQLFQRQGLSTDDALEDPAESVRLLEHGHYSVVATSLAENPAGGESLYSRVRRLSPEARRRVFVVLVGDDFRSGDGTAAFTVLADLVLNPADVARADGLLHRARLERQRLYRTFLDAQRRAQES